jgi:hypothetical protein
MLRKPPKRTEALLAANRANSQLSTGPVTASGKLASRRNAVKHWGRAETIRPSLAALGEDAEEFESVRDALYRALAPRDDFERIIVDDMADIHWRTGRMVRAEAGAQGSRRREKKRREEEIDATFEAGKFHDLVPSIIPTVGFVGLTDSPVKFRRILELLGALGDLVRYEGFRDEFLGYLQTVYGRNPSDRARSLMHVYERCNKERDCGDADRIAANQAEFLEAIADEIVWFKRRAAAHLQALEDLRVPTLDAEMLKIEQDPAKIAVYHERLERVFADKWRLLKEYRANRAATQQQETGKEQEAPEERENEEQENHRQASPETGTTGAVVASVEIGPTLGPKMSPELVPDMVPEMVPERARELPEAGVSET